MYFENLIVLFILKEVLRSWRIAAIFVIKEQLLVTMSATLLEKLDVSGKLISKKLEQYKVILLRKSKFVQAACAQVRLLVQSNKIIKNE